MSVLGPENRQHKFAYEQLAEVDSETFQGHVKILALLDGCCAAHRAPMYGCEAGVNNFTFCEEVLKPLSESNKRKLN